MSASRGLEGVIVAESSITSIIDDQLTYVGYSIDDLAEHASFEEVVYLLWHKRLPTEIELKKFQAELLENMELSDQIIEHLKLFNPSTANPMAVLRSTISLLGLYDPEVDDMSEEANFRKAIRLQAKIAAIITTLARLRQNKQLIAPDPNLSYAGNFLRMLKGPDVEALEVEAFNKALVLHADHELNASTFTARVCVATLSDLYSGVTAAIGALKGPLHGGANEQVVRMLMEIEEVDNAIPYVKNKIANKEKVMGMGHRVYRTGDPRAKHLKEMSRKLTEITGQSKWYDMSVKIEEYMKKEKGLPANVDFYSASAYHCMGIDHDLFTPIFAMSRTSGWVAHMLEQYDNNRLIRPRAEFVGEVQQEYKPVEQR